MNWIFDGLYTSAYLNKQGKIVFGMFSILVHVFFFPSVKWFSLPDFPEKSFMFCGGISLLGSVRTFAASQGTSDVLGSRERDAKSCTAHRIVSPFQLVFCFFFSPQLSLWLLDNTGGSVVIFKLEIGKIKSGDKEAIISIRKLWSQSGNYKVIMWKMIV